jgi:hypothetical protein
MRAFRPGCILSSLRAYLLCWAVCVLAALHSANQRRTGVLGRIRAVQPVGASIPSTVSGSQSQAVEEVPDTAS